MRRLRILGTVLLDLYIVLGITLYLVCVTNLRDNRYIMMVPYMNYILEFVRTVSGMAVLIIIPGAILFVFLVSRFVDMRQENSRHRKRILRKKKRRNERYLKEGLYTSRRAVI